MTIPGLSAEDMADFRRVMDGLPEVERVWLFGSRAKGTYKPGSDVDLAIEVAEHGFESLRRMRYLLNEETHLPYRFDVVDRNTIVSPELQDHLRRVGQVVYEKGSEI